jgi:peptidyl-prolyl cis-trans isomerase B (cyclophilin B)
LVPLLVVLAAAGGSAQAAPRAGCTTVPRPPARPDGGQKRPTALLPRNRVYTAVVVTNCGTFSIRLDQGQSPRTVASIVALADRKFFDRTIFHRIVPGFVIQGGDPTQTGSGGPGYTTVDVPPRSARYVRGVVAMAKTQAQAPGAAGSQFFVVTGANAGLPPDYAIVGRVVSGLDVVLRIGKLGDPGTEQPTRVVEIERMRIRVSGS